jgi:hypothetical protein
MDDEMLNQRTVMPDSPYAEQANAQNKYNTFDAQAIGRAHVQQVMAQQLGQQLGSLSGGLAGFAPLPHRSLSLDMANGTVSVAAALHTPQEAKDLIDAICKLCDLAFAKKTG